MNLIPHFQPAILSKKLLTWYRNNNRQLPWRAAASDIKDPYATWVSEIMLQQTQISTVIPVYQRFMGLFPKVQILAAATEEELRSAVRGLGYYRRFSFLHRAAQKLAQTSPVAWPNTYEDWKDLSGIGPYTAAALSSIVNGEAHMVVDGNVERVFARVFNIQEDVTSIQWKKNFKRAGDRIISKEAPGDYNQAIMELGQLICSPRNPDCHACPISYACKAKKLGTIELAPAPKQRQKFVEEKLSILVPLKNGRIGIGKRAKDAKFLKGIEGFLTFQGDVSKPSRHLGKIKHSITKHKIEANVSVLDLDCKKNTHIETGSLRFFAIGEIEPFLTSNLDRKALKLLVKNSAKLNLL